MRSIELTEWLNDQAEERGWSFREMARRAELSHSAISNVIAGNALPGWDFCLGISRALGVPPETVFRKAGLLPSLPPAVEEEREVIGILRHLPAAIRVVVLTMLRALARAQGQPVAAVAEPPGLYQVEDDAYIPELLDEFSKVPDDWKEVAIQEVARIRHFADLPRARFVGEEEEIETERRQGS